MYSYYFLLDHIQFTLIRGTNTPGSYAILFFAALGFTFITRHIHKWESFPLRPGGFILSGAISSCPLSSPEAYRTPSYLGGSSFGVISFCIFIKFMRFLWQVYWDGLPFPPPVDDILSELSTMIHPSWVVLHSMAHSFIELHKPLDYDKAVICEGAFEQYLALNYHYCPIYNMVENKSLLEVLFQKDYPSSSFVACVCLLFGCLNLFTNKNMAPLMISSFFVLFP